MIILRTICMAEKLIPWQGRLEMSQAQMKTTLKWELKEYGEGLVQNKIISRSLSVVIKFHI
jgi:hypothetical protein